MPPTRGTRVEINNDYLGPNFRGGSGCGTSGSTGNGPLKPGFGNGLGFCLGTPPGGGSFKISFRFFGFSTSAGNSVGMAVVGVEGMLSEAEEGHSKYPMPVAMIEKPIEKEAINPNSATAPEERLARGAVDCGGLRAEAEKEIVEARATGAGSGGGTKLAVAFDSELWRPIVVMNSEAMVKNSWHCVHL